MIEIFLERDVNEIHLLHRLAFLPCVAREMLNCLKFDEFCSLFRLDRQFAQSAAFLCSQPTIITCLGKSSHIRAFLSSSHPFTCLNHLHLLEWSTGNSQYSLIKAENVPNLMSLKVFCDTTIEEKIAEKLTELDLFASYPSHSSIVKYVNSPNLKKVRVHGKVLEDLVFSQEKLFSLEVSNCPSISITSSAHNLKFLKLSSVGHLNMARTENLQVLHLDNITSIELSSESLFRSLVELHISNLLSLTLYNLTATFSSLSLLTSVTVTCVSEMNISSLVTASPCLQSITLYDVSRVVLVSSLSLETLILQKNCTVASSSPILSYPRLQHLQYESFNKNSISFQTFISFFNSFSTPSLTSLKFLLSMSVEMVDLSIFPQLHTAVIFNPYIPSSATFHIKGSSTSLVKELFVYVYFVTPRLKLTSFPQLTMFKCSDTFVTADNRIEFDEQTPSQPIIEARQKYAQNDPDRYSMPMDDLFSFLQNCQY